jgi:hypothetical protein
MTAKDSRDTQQQLLALRRSRAARVVRARFGAGARVRGYVGGQEGTVLRHIPMGNAQGGGAGRALGQRA